MAKKNSGGLNEQQERYCREFQIDFNQTQAAIRSGYAESSARQYASELMDRPEIQDRIRELADKKNKRLEVRADDVLREMTIMGYSDIRGIYDEKGVIKPMSDWPEEIARAISAIESEELFDGVGKDRTWIGYVKRVKLWPKDRAIEMLAKNQKILVDRHEHTGKDGKAITFGRDLSDEELAAKVQTLIADLSSPKAIE